MRGSNISGLLRFARKDGMKQSTKRVEGSRASGIDLVSRILHRDGLMLIVDKPAGIAVHAGPSGGPSLEDGFEALRFGLPNPPALAHRLDRDTSGCLVLGRHRKALAKLGRLFSSGAVEKVYWAVVDGAPASDAGRVELALRKLTNKAGWRMVADASGLAALTEYRVLGRAAGMAWLELKPRSIDVQVVRNEPRHGHLLHQQRVACRARLLHLHRTPRP